MTYKFTKGQTVWALRGYPVTEWARGKIKDFYRYNQVYHTGDSIERARLRMDDGKLLHCACSNLLTEEEHAARSLTT